MRDIEQSRDLAKQVQNDEDIYELKLYVICNNRRSQLAFENLKNICLKYLAGKCHIEVIDLTKNPSLAKEDQIIAIPTLMRKNYPRRRVIGDLSSPEKVLEILELRISNLMHTVDGKSPIEKNSAEESEAHTVRSKNSKDDLQPYIGSDFGNLSQKIDSRVFSLSCNLN